MPDRCAHRCCDIPDDPWHDHYLGPDDCIRCEIAFDEEDDSEEDEEE